MRVVLEKECEEGNPPFSVVILLNKWCPTKLVAHSVECPASFVVIDAARFWASFSISSQAH